jgi:ferritin-like metal-binding protein YciE
MEMHENLQALYVDQLRDLYSAERQILDALPKMVKRSTHRELQNALDHHRVVTEHQVDRLKQIFDELEQKERGETCEAMQGLLKEGARELEHWHDHDVLDAAIIAAAQRVEHYEMAGYGTARTIAQTLGLHRHAELLQQTLNEEREADKTLTHIAESVVNPEAVKVEARVR